MQASNIKSSNILPIQHRSSNEGAHVNIFFDGSYDWKRFVVAYSLYFDLYGGSYPARRSWAYLHSLRRLHLR
jgi:hypothetical protein